MSGHSEKIRFRGPHKHIYSLSFSSRPARFLRGAKEWKNIPKFSVITGHNGSGKSHLLEYASQCLYQKEGNKGFPYRHIYLPSNHEITSIEPHNHSSSKGELVNLIWKVLNGQEKVTSESINSLVLKLVEGRFFNSYEGFGAVQFKEDIENALTKNKNGALSRKFVEELIQKYFPSYRSANQSINLLNAVLRDYNIKKENYMSRDPEEFKLKEYASQNHPNIFPGKYPNASTMLNDFQNIQKEVREKYFESRISEELGKSPFEEINQILKDYNFNFIIRQNDNKNKKDEVKQFWLQRKDVNYIKRIQPEYLSSGEKKILEMLAWFYYHSSDKNYGDRRLNIMLLDEPDRHLDAKFLVTFLNIVSKEFVNKNVQVLMTTHRPDTIALVKEESIFILERKSEANISEVVPVSKLCALYRLMQNLRDRMSTQIKVYAESTDDAEFYWGVYRSLLQYSNIQRSNIQKGKNQRNLKKPIIFQRGAYKTRPERLLSRRYKLFFVAASQNKGQKGGWERVKDCISRDKDIQDKFINERAKGHSMGMIDNDFHLSLGIIDNDGETGQYKGKFKGLEDRYVQVEGRYTIENFFFDPFVLCSSVKPEIAAATLKYMVREVDKDIKAAKIQEKRKEFQGICEQIEQDLKMIESMESSSEEALQRINIQAHLDKYFDFLAATLANNKSFSEDNPANQDQKENKNQNQSQSQSQNQNHNRNQSKKQNQNQNQNRNRNRNQNQNRNRNQNNRQEPKSPSPERIVPEESKHLNPPSSQARTNSENPITKSLEENFEQHQEDNVRLNKNLDSKEIDQNLQENKSKKDNTKHQKNKRNNNEEQKSSQNERIIPKSHEEEEKANDLNPPPTQRTTSHTENYSKLQTSEEISKFKEQIYQNNKQKDKYKNNKRFYYVYSRKQEPAEAQSSQVEEENKSSSNQVQIKATDFQTKISEETSGPKGQVQIKKNDNFKQRSYQKPQYKKISEKGFVDILVLAKVHKVLSVKYPNAFFYESAKEIKDQIFKGNTGGLAKKIKDHVYGNGLKFIPEDLSTAIFKLNEIAVAKCRGNKVRKVQFSSKNTNSQKIYDSNKP